MIFHISNTCYTEKYGLTSTHRHHVQSRYIVLRIVKRLIATKYRRQLSVTEHLDKDSKCYNMIYAALASGLTFFVYNHTSFVSSDYSISTNKQDNVI